MPRSELRARHRKAATDGRWSLRRRCGGCGSSASVLCYRQAGAGAGAEAARQADCELGKLAERAVDRDRAAMLLSDDVIADRQAEPGSLPGRLRCEERLEQLVAKFGCDAGAVVAHSYLDRVAETLCRHRQYRPKAVAGLAPAFVGGIKAVAEQIEEHPCDVLRHNLDRSDGAVEIALQGNVEALILGARAMIGEVERLLDERVDVGRLPIAAAAARMRQHALDDAVGAAAVLGDLVEIAGQHADRLVEFRTGSLVERSDAGRSHFLQLVEKFDREPSEVVDEVERVLDFVGDAGGQLAERRHLLGMEETSLRCLQFLQRLLGGVPRSADLGLRALALGDIAVDQYKAAARHRVAAYLDDLP